MKHVLQTSKIALFAGLFIIVICTSAWQIQGNKGAAEEDYKQAGADTIGPGAVNIDEIDLGVNSDSMLKAAQTAIAAIDLTKLQQQIKTSLANINFDEMNKNIEVSLNKIDWDKMKVEVDVALDEAKAEMAKVNTKEIKESMEKAMAEMKTEQLNQKINLSNLQNELQESLENAKKEIKKSEVEIANYRALIGALEKDGFIKAGQSYTVALKDNVLYINGAKQSKETTDKYRKYYNGKTNFSIYDSKRQKEHNGGKGRAL